MVWACLGIVYKWTFINILLYITELILAVEFRFNVLFLMFVNKLGPVLDKNAM